MSISTAKLTSKARTVTELAGIWNVTKQWIRDRINAGDLVARDISKPGSKRANFRIDLEDADAFWESLSNRTKPRPQRKSDAVRVSGTDDFSDFM